MRSLSVFPNRDRLLVLLWKSAPPTQRTTLGNPCRSVHFLIIRQCPTCNDTCSFTPSEIFYSPTQAILKYLHSSYSTMSRQDHPRTMPTPQQQQCSLTLRPQLHCTIWQPVSHKYASARVHQQSQQRKRAHSTTTNTLTNLQRIHPALPPSIQSKTRCTIQPNPTTTTWHTRRHSTSRLGLVDHTTSSISKRTQLGTVQMVPVLYRRHLARIIIRLGSGATRSDL